MLQNIAEQKNLPELSEKLNENAENYIQQIENVIQVTQKILSDTPEKFIVVADRFPFVYFTEFYGINYAAAFSGCSTAVEASTNTIAKIIDIVNKKHLPAIFYIELGNHKMQPKHLQKKLPRLGILQLRTIHRYYARQAKQKRRNGLHPICTQQLTQCVRGSTRKQGTANCT